MYVCFEVRRVFPQGYPASLQNILINLAIMNGWILLHKKIWKNRLLVGSPLALSVWVWLLTHADEKGMVRCGRSQVASDTGVKAESVRYWIDKFIREGQLTVKERNGNYSHFEIVKWAEYQRKTLQQDYSRTTATTTATTTASNKVKKEEDYSTNYNPHYESSTRKLPLIKNKEKEIIHNTYAEKVLLSKTKPFPERWMFDSDQDFNTALKEYKLIKHS
jgi:hypothetical protein